jgi:excisionase family DNA binding protein
MSDTQSIPRSRQPAAAVEPITPLSVRPKDAMRMLGFGQTHFYRLLKDGELLSYRDGGARRVLVSSIHDYIARRLAASQTDRS